MDRLAVPVALAATLAATVVHACGVGTFACEDPSDCVDGGMQGTCEPGGGCSFPDDRCDSGKRYGEHAPGGLGGQCVPIDGGSESGGATVTASATSAGTGTTLTTSADGSASEGSTTLGASASATTTAGSATDTTDATTDAKPGGEASTGGPPGPFFDPFDRPNSAELGNGWIEKMTDAWHLVDEQVELDFDNGHDFRNNLFHRPLDESMLDVEASVVVNFTTDLPWGYPQLHVRVQPADIDTQGSLTSYAVFVDAADPADVSLTVSRIDGPSFGPQEYAPIDPDPIDIETYRLRLRATGTDPVTVEGFFEIDNGNGWEIRANATLVDNDVDRIVAPGTVGASGHLELQWFVLDDFAYEDLA